ncbi:MAG: class I SAM-dependent methyltransferase [Phenylobacterium sp.]
MTASRRQALGLAAAALVLASAPGALAADAALAKAVASEARPAADRARDKFRNPAQSLSFWGLKPGQTVVEVSPGGGYWTEILAPYALATKGRYIAGVADLANPSLSEGARMARADFEARFADTARYGKVEFVGFGAVSGPLGPPGSADLVLTARNIHNWMWTPGMLPKVMNDFNAVLKKGGVLAVEEHRSDPRPMAADGRDGYVSEAAVIAAAEAAGFRLDARSEINANPKDSKDHPFGVWTLPPVRRSSAPGAQPAPDFDRARYDAIGESDRMTLRFVKVR